MRTRLTCFAVAFASLVLIALALSRAHAQPSPSHNVSLGRPYTLSPKPDYSYCTDSGDATQLTDGEYTQGHFWTQLSTVGWNGGDPVQIVVDLQRQCSIGGMSYSTAAGVAGVEWPLAMYISVSDDGKLWRSAGELTSLSLKHSMPPGKGYALHRFTTDALRCRGRYVALQIATAGYTFCDELEIYGSELTVGAAETARGETITDLVQSYRVRKLGFLFAKRVHGEAADLLAACARSNLPTAEKQQFVRRAEQITLASELRQEPPKSRAIFPYSPEHAQIQALRAAYWQKVGVHYLVWASNPWAPLQPDDLPAERRNSTHLDFTMLRDEIRGQSLNVTNPDPASSRLQISVQGLSNAVTVNTVPFTGTRSGGATASAIVPCKQEGGAWLALAPAGLTTQLWISVDSAKLKPGTHKGKIRIFSGASVVTEVPLEASVSHVRMPAKLDLSLGGWDYTNDPTYGITAHTLNAAVKFLQKYHVDAPWAHDSVIPFGEHATDGHMVKAPSTEKMDVWLNRWKGSRFYFIACSYPDVLPQTPEANRRIHDWITFWVNHLKKRGIRPDQLGLLLMDEPRTGEVDKIIVSYAAAIHRAEPQVKVFEDPIWEDPRMAAQSMYAASDILCPNRGMWIEKRRTYEAVFTEQQKRGKQLAFYSCSGPVRSLDPYSYHRLQAWDCFRYGCVHMGFWAFGDAGEGSSWNELAAKSTGFAPEFLDGEGFTTSKHMEAIREGMFDFQTLTLLRQAADSCAKKHQKLELVKRARMVLADGPRRVTEAQGVNSFQWADKKDRSEADRVRTEAIRLLERLR